MPTRALRVRIRGFVQGVGFRYFVRREARVLGLSGFARNRPDGSVEVVAVGEDAAVEQLLERLRAGPPGSRVRHVECETLDPVPAYEAFEITG